MPLLFVFHFFFFVFCSVSVFLFCSLEFLLGYRTTPMKIDHGLVWQSAKMKNMFFSIVIEMYIRICAKQTVHINVIRGFATLKISVFVGDVRAFHIYIACIYHYHNIIWIVTMWSLALAFPQHSADVATTALDTSETVFAYLIIICRCWCAMMLMFVAAKHQRYQIESNYKQHQLI